MLGFVAVIIDITKLRSYSYDLNSYDQVLHLASHSACSDSAKSVVGLELTDMSPVAAGHLERKWGERSTFQPRNQILIKG